MHRRSFLRRLFAAVPAAVAAPAVAAELVKAAAVPVAGAVVPPPMPPALPSQYIYTGTSGDHTHSWCSVGPPHTHTVTVQNRTHTHSGVNGWTNNASTYVTF